MGNFGELYAILCDISVAEGCVANAICGIDTFPINDLSNFRRGRREVAQALRGEAPRSNDNATGGSA